MVLILRQLFHGFADDVDDLIVNGVILEFAMLICKDHNTPPLDHHPLKRFEVWVELEQNVIIHLLMIIEQRSFVHEHEEIVTCVEISVDDVL